MAARRKDTRFRWRPLDQAGAAAVEFAFMFPIWMLTIVGMADWGMVFMTRLELERAMNIAVDTAVGFTDPDIITSAILNSGINGDMKSALTTYLAENPPTITKECAGGTDPLASGFCDDDGTVSPFSVVEIQLQYTHQMWFDWPAIAAGDITFNLTRRVTVSG